MPLASDIMKGGTSAGQSIAFNGQVAPAISAAGTIITDATDLAATINVITTCASGAGVQLPNAMVGDSVEILNLGANQCLVYPDASANRINAVGAGNSFILPTNTACICRKFSTTRWAAFLSA